MPIPAFVHILGINSQRISYITITKFKRKLRIKSKNLSIGVVASMS